MKKIFLEVILRFDKDLLLEVLLALRMEHSFCEVRTKVFCKELQQVDWKTHQACCLW